MRLFWGSMVPQNNRTALINPAISAKLGRLGLERTV